jgi:hypothetical protein
MEFYRHFSMHQAGAWLHAVTSVPHPYGANVIQAVSSLGCPLKISVTRRGGAAKWGGGGETGSNSVNDRHTYPPFIALVPGKIPPHMNKSDVYPSPKLTVRIKTELAATELARALALTLFFSVKKALGSNTAH